MENTHLTKLFKSFQTGIRAKKSEKPRQYLETLGLDFTELEIGFNSGQFHHRKDEEFRKPYVELGMLTKSNAAVREKDMTAYTCFGAYGIVFPLKDENGNIVNYYITRIKLASTPSEYLNNQGIYPNYPHELTKKLYITNNIIDAASMLQAKVLDSREAVISLHDGEILPQHYQAIQNLNQIQQIIIIKS